MSADFRSPKSLNILGLLEKLTGTGRPPGDSATKELPGSAGRERLPAGSGCGSACRSARRSVPAGWDVDHTRCFHEFARQLFGRSGVKASQLLGEPAVATVGQDSHGGVKIHIESNLTRQTIEVKEIHADPQPVLDAIAASVAHNQRPRTLLRVVGQEQRWLRTAESRDRQLA